MVFCLYLVTAGGDVRSQSLHLAVEDVVFLHLVLHRGQVLSKALVVQVVLDTDTKQDTLATTVRDCGQTRVRVCIKFDELHGNILGTSGRCTNNLFN